MLTPLPPFLRPPHNSACVTELDSLNSSSHDTLFLCCKFIFGPIVLNDLGQPDPIKIIATMLFPSAKIQNADRVALFQNVRPERKKKNKKRNSRPVFVPGVPRGRVYQSTRFSADAIEWLRGEVICIHYLAPLPHHDFKLTGTGSQIIKKLGDRQKPNHQQIQ